MELVWKRYKVTFKNVPILLIGNSGMTGFELYQKVWQAMLIYFKPGSKYFLQENLWWNYYEKGGNGSCRPFIIRNVNDEGKCCGVCSWKEQCLGCNVQPSQEKATIDWNSYLSVDWYLDAFGDIEEISDIKEHSSFKNKKNKRPEIQLIDLLKNFTRREKLEEVKCDNCIMYGQGLREYYFFRAPKILILHLKRYHEASIQYFSKYCKNSIAVDFPLDNLDIFPFMHYSVEKGPTNYDLFAMICHYGMLNNGHYFAYIRTSKGWFCYNDTKIEAVQPQDMKMDKAYILFYQRKDTKGKSLGDIFPTLDKQFIGKAVETKFGWGLIEEIRPEKDCDFKIRFFDSNAVYYTSSSEVILPDHQKILDQLKEYKEMQKPNEPKKEAKESKNMQKLIVTSDKDSHGSGCVLF